jgi:hypothetical protein
LRKNIEAKLLKQKNYVLRNKNITDIEIDAIKENVTSHVQYNIRGQHMRRRN